MVDEGLQWLLPSRVFEWKDVWLNVLSSGLGMLGVAVLWEGGQEGLKKMSNYEC